MPWKFILFIFFLILGAVFTGLNLENACNINFGFKTFEQIPVFLTILFAFLAGIVVTLPFTLTGKKDRPPKGMAEKQAKPRKSLFAKKDKQSKAEEPFVPEAISLDDELPFSGNKRP